jgi:hypothetical protein
VANSFALASGNTAPQGIADLLMAQFELADGSAFF